jgi:hypothetical protein
MRRRKSIEEFEYDTKKMQINQFLINSIGLIQRDIIEERKLQ